MVSEKSKPLKKINQRKVVRAQETDNQFFWQALTLVMGVLLIISVYTSGFTSPSMGSIENNLNKLLERDLEPGTKNAINNALTALQSIETDPDTDVPSAEDLPLIIVNDKQCSECQLITPLIDQLKSLFNGLEVIEYDFEDEKGRQLYEDLELSALPAFLFNEKVTDSEGYTNVQRYLEQKGEYFSLRVGASYDPFSEICDNEVDDRDQDGLIDCDDDECSSQWKCMEKREKSEVELFIMSHCPFGTQMEKGILPAVELLGDKIDFNVRFVYYAMHGEPEVKEQARQYCIQKEQNDKFLEYVKCFLKEGKSDECLTDVDTDMLNTCVEEIDEEYDITANLEDQSSWLSGRYPLFNTDLELNKKYSVGGSPTLVINGVVASAARDPASLLDAICTGFKEKPEECNVQLSSAAYNPGFGFTQTGQEVSTGSCG